MGTLLKNGNEFLHSNEPAYPDAEDKSGYGQNGYTGASSSTGKRVTTGFLPDPVAPINSQMRQVDATPIAAAHGTRDRLKTDYYPQVPANGRPVKKNI